MQALPHKGDHRADVILSEATLSPHIEPSDPFNDRGRGPIDPLGQWPARGIIANYLVTTDEHVGGRYAMGSWLSRLGFYVISTLDYEEEFLCGAMADAVAQGLFALVVLGHCLTKSADGQRPRHALPGCRWGWMGGQRCMLWFSPGAPPRLLSTVTSGCR